MLLSITKEGRKSVSCLVSQSRVSFFFLDSLSALFSLSRSIPSSSRWFTPFLCTHRTTYCCIITPGSRPWKTDTATPEAKTTWSVSCSATTISTITDYSKHKSCPRYTIHSISILLLYTVELLRPLPISYFPFPHFTPGALFK